MFVKIYNQEGKETGKTLLPKEIFEVKMNADLVHQIMVSYQANKRQGTAHTKQRGEVRGGGKKPWRQKGTGRARHGSIRSPIWKGGGVAFGPRKEKIYKKQIPKKMRRKALFMVLSAKAQEKTLLVLNELKLETIKTKKGSGILENFNKNIKGFKNSSILLALPENNKNIVLSFRNIPKTQTIQAKDLNVLDLLNYKYLILPKKSIKVIKETFT